MKLLKSALAILGSRWFWALVGAVLLSLVVWYFGDLLQIGTVRPLATEPQRLICILGIAVLWGASNLWAQARARRSNDLLVKALAPAAAHSDPGSAEVQELGRRFQGALDQLRRSKLGGRGGRRWLYELPWYVMIGPPGSGKTTAIAQSGLRFPAAEMQDLKGVGGTRYCDWFFTDEAVLIDTAGRYTTQDSDAAADRAAWEGFLDLLKKHRPRQPLNGVLVALSIKDLLSEAADGVDHATRIRGRLEEIERSLGLRLPVYLLITKADLIAGFTSFFDDLGEHDREQVWGYSFASAPGSAPTIDRSALRAGFEDLVARLDRRMPRRLAEETDPARRAEMFNFPAQVVLLGAAIARFVERCFPPSTYEHGAWLRGVYLTSGSQSGTPVDRLLAAVAASVGLPAPAALPASGERSFFLTRLLRDVVFGEASLVSRDPRRERRERLVRIGALSGMLAVAAAALAAWIWSYEANRALQDRVAADLAAWSQQVKPIAQNHLKPGEGDYLAVLPALDALGNTETRLAAPEPWTLRLGLSQQASEDARIAAAYRAAVAHLLLPRLVLSLEQSLRSRLGEPDYVLEGLKVYFMLGGKAPLDPDLVQTWFTLDAQARAPQQRGSASRHLAVLVQLLPTIDPKPSLDAGLVAQAQQVLAKIPLAKRAYQALLAAPEVRGLPGWKVTDHAGPNAGFTLTRRSGAPLDQPIPALFTYDGFHQVFLALLDRQARATFGEAWVLSGSAARPTDADIERLKAGMLSLYYDDMIAAWDGLLHDVTLTPFGSSIDRAEQMTKALSGPSSPLKLLILAVVHETDLTAPPPPSNAAPAASATAAATTMVGKLSGNLGKLAALIDKPAQAATPTEVPGAPVAQHFAYLKPLVLGANGAPPALDDALATLGALHAKLAEAALAPNPGDAAAKLGVGSGGALKQAAQRLPSPLKEMLGGIAATTDAVSVAGVRQQINASWQGDVLPFCRSAITDRFPFSRNSTTDADMEDVVRVFGPTGLIQSFIKQQLQPYVDTSRQPWRPVQTIGLSSAALSELARAQRIGMSLFGGGATPKAAFTLTPLSLDPGSASVALDLDGQSLYYDHGPVRPKSFTWPGPGGTNVVRLSFAPIGGGAPLMMSDEGPWSLFRLIHTAQFKPTGQPDVFNIAFSLQGHAASFRLQAASVENPFDLRLMEGFDCPGGM